MINYNLSSPYPIDRFHFVAKHAASDIVANTKAPDTLVSAAILTKTSLAIQEEIPLSIQVESIACHPKAAGGTNDHS